ncbi:MAG: hypothetical protein BWX79_01698 [Alphaproteobacteria bacterium ADurb.Bin100]|nr:MAG: hypothetical protein BWX79_01698 [Alphaproteobacteria bacterium ADurb.Bin100]
MLLLGIVVLMASAELRPSPLAPVETAPAEITVLLRFRV